MRIVRSLRRKVRYRELIKVSGSMPLSLASERKRFNPSLASRSRLDSLLRLAQR